MHRRNGRHIFLFFDYVHACDSHMWAYWDLFSLFFNIFILVIALCTLILLKIWLLVRWSFEDIYKTHAYFNLSYGLIKLESHPTFLLPNTVEGLKIVFLCNTSLLWAMAFYKTHSYLIIRTSCHWESKLKILSLSNEERFYRKYHHHHYHYHHLFIIIQSRKHMFAISVFYGFLYIIKWYEKEKFLSLYMYICHSTCTRTRAKAQAELAPTIQSLIVISETFSNKITKKFTN
jgi:hypothetical protein